MKSSVCNNRKENAMKIKASRFYTAKDLKIAELDLPAPKGNEV